jgi:RHS repeat-associated protein
MPTAFNYAGERLDSQTGLLYDTFRYYDPLSGRFVRADNVQDNSGGIDPYAYVGDNPEIRNDPSGHCWPLCPMILGAVIGAAISVATTVVSNAVQGKPTSLGEIAQSAVVGAVSGAVSGLAGPEAGPVARMAVGALASGAGQMASNARSGLPLLDGVAKEGDLKFIQHDVNGTEIYHTVITEGKPVLAAGEADISAASGQYWVTEITNHSGHYLPDIHSLENDAKPLFRKFGF